jgi:phage shock protein PspC (stress-responsive transcriptional regulator)
MNRFKNFIEWHLFGVCTWVGDKMGISTLTIRKYFIYLSFLTLGSPVVIYLVMAFFMNLKRYMMSGRRNPLRYL